MSILDKFLGKQNPQKNTPNPQDTFRIFYEEHVEKIFKFIYYKTGSKELAEDLTAETFLKTWKYIEKNDIENIKSFVYRVANNLVIDHWRSKNKIPLSLPDDGDAGDVPAVELDLENILDSQLSLKIVYQALEHIHPQYKEVVTLKYLNEFSTEEIAQILGKTRNNINVLLFRALKALKEYIQNNDQIH